MAKRAKLPPKSAARVARIGGHSAYRSALGYLPEGYHQNPQRFAPRLNLKQKARVSRMHQNLSAPRFKELYGFNRMPKKLWGRYIG